MSDAKSPPEPSLDEVLANVRRIIAEDDKQPAAPRAGDGDDVLELTEAINEDGSTRRLPPIGSAARRAPGSAAPDSDRLVSDGVSLAAQAALARLAAVTRAQRGPATAADHALDDIVRDLLRPLLQTWLDENLPEIVERLVQTEIARVVGRSGVA